MPFKYAGWMKRSRFLGAMRYHRAWMGRQRYLHGAVGRRQAGTEKPCSHGWQLFLPRVWTYRRDSCAAGEPTRQALFG